jgi:RNA polymerase sigma-70 factor (ECF subfamily)
MEVKSAMYKLSDDHRTVLDLRIMKGYSVSETAILLNKSEEAVRTSQYRALQSLAQMLDVGY